MLSLLWTASRGYRLTPWRSPYLKWRLETYFGVPAETIGCAKFFRLMWASRHEILRYLRWAERMQARHIA